MTSRSAVLKILATLVASVALGLPLASRADDDTASVIRIAPGAGAATQPLAIPMGQSAVIDLPVDARDVLVSKPTVVTAVLRTARRIYVVGVAPGVTDAQFFDAQGRRILALKIRVDANTYAIAQTIRRVLPGSHVKVEAMNGSIILSGTVDSTADADKAVQIATLGLAGSSSYSQTSGGGSAPSAAPSGGGGSSSSTSTTQTVLNMLTITGKEQVMLKVRIVEMDRQLVKQLGFNWNAVFNGSGNTQFQFAQTPVWGANGSFLGNLFGQITKNKFAPGYTGLSQFVAAAQAFEQVGLVRTLAEPNLTATSGESAQFLVGGEFPVPMSTSALGQVSVTMETFGVGLGFTPVVLSGGRISLKLTTEVSELSNQGSFNISTGVNSPTLSIPALSVRRASTVVELPSGGGLMIAGLLEDKSSQALAGVPGAQDLPVLGALLRSRDFLAQETELVVIVTPYLVDSTSPANLQTPIDGLELSSDFDAALLGRLNKTYGRDQKTAPGRTYQGPYGYVVE
jgi:pilus assembly protein CpaC